MEDNLVYDNNDSVNDQSALFSKKKKISLTVIVLLHVIAALLSPLIGGSIILFAPLIVPSIPFLLFYQRNQSKGVWSALLTLAHYSVNSSIFIIVWFFQIAIVFVFLVKGLKKGPINSEYYGILVAIWIVFLSVALVVWYNLWFRFSLQNDMFVLRYQSVFLNASVSTYVFILFRVLEVITSLTIVSSSSIPYLGYSGRSVHILERSFTSTTQQASEIPSSKVTFSQIFTFGKYILGWVSSAKKYADANVLFWIMLAIIIVYIVLFILLITLVVLLNSSFIPVSVSRALIPYMPTAVQWLSITIPNGLFTTIVSVMVGQLDCTYTSLTNGRTGYSTLDLDTEIRCWHGKHLPRAIISIFSISFVSVTVTISIIVVKLVLNKTGKDLLGAQQNDFQYSDKFLIRETACRLVYSCINSLFSNYPFISLTASIISNVYLYENNRFSGTVVKWMNSIRCGVCALVIWTASVGLVLVSCQQLEIKFTRAASLPPLIIGWVLIVIGTIVTGVVESIQIYSRPHHSNETELMKLYYFGYEDYGMAFQPVSLSSLYASYVPSFRRKIDLMLRKSVPQLWKIGEKSREELREFQRIAKLEENYIHNTIYSKERENLGKILRTFYGKNLNPEEEHGCIDPGYKRFFNEIRVVEELDSTEWDIMLQDRQYTVYTTNKRVISYYDHNLKSTTPLLVIPEYLKVRKILVRLLEYRYLDGIIHHASKPQLSVPIDTVNQRVFEYSDQQSKLQASKQQRAFEQPPEFEFVILTREGELYISGRMKNILISQVEVDPATYQTIKLDLPGLKPKEKVVKIAMGTDHYLFRTNYGHLFTIGSNEYGQTGTGSGIDDIKPKKLAYLKKLFVKEVWCGKYCSIVLARGRSFYDKKTKKLELRPGNEAERGELQLVYDTDDERQHSGRKSDVGVHDVELEEKAIVMDQMDL